MRSIRESGAPSPMRSGPDWRRWPEIGNCCGVTHLPQVAAYAGRHLLVRKQVRQGQTRTEVVALDRDSRIDEIARMLSGKQATDASRSHARQLIGATEDRVGSPP